MKLSAPSQGSSGGDPHQTVVDATTSQLAATLLPATDNTYDIGSSAKRWGYLNAARGFKLFGTVSDTQPIVSIDDQKKLAFGPGGASGVDWSMSRTAVGTVLIPTGSKLQQTDAPTVGADLVNKTFVDNAVDPLNKLFFSHNSLLPATTHQEQLYDYPATDFAGLNSGTKAVNMSRARFTPSGAGYIWGWDSGALRLDTLFIFNLVRSRQSGFYIFVNDAAPSGTDITGNGYMFGCEPATPALVAYKVVSGVFTAIGTELKLAHADDSVANSLGLAMYYKASTDRFAAFVRSGVEAWMPIVDVTDTTLVNGARYYGLRGSAGTGTPANQVTWNAVPMGFYYNT